ncbi:UNVERIFIED_CONTAM: F-box/kelch-repeat protein [Sesamum latifolium]|uniref:F-box/kelch-repeat protein n=1 Tax=Sesamum latifolium TaxID=2727402 RepID=A0AAW2WLY8_9LAMI
MQRVRVSSQQAPVQKLGNSQIPLSPKFRLAAVQSTLLDPALEFELSSRGEPLIPGLPDDVALQCLLRVPVDKHAACKAVCKRWYSLFGSKEQFFTRRKELGFHDPWLFVFAYHKCTGKIEWKVWISPTFLGTQSLLCLARTRSAPRASVLKYDVRKNRWTTMTKMITPRSFFASGVIDGMVYVAGGSSTDLFELNSAEVLDPKKGTWKPVANMGMNMASYDTAVLNGKLLVTEGWFWPFYGTQRPDL